MFQKEFLVQIKQVIGDNVSINEVLAQTLDISYDAAHRRASGKSKISLEESIVLAKKYDMSLDALFAISSKKMVAVEKTQGISNSKELEHYFNHSIASLSGLSKIRNGKILYSAKDIPIFYLLKGDILTRFKIFVWLKLLDDSFTGKDFTSFQPALSLLESAKALGSVYADVATIEIWDITTINSTLKQIHFYFEAGLLLSEDALAICESLHLLIASISERIQHPELFKLYYNELLLMNNQVLVSSYEKDALYVPFTMLSYFFCSDRETTLQAKQYFNKQMRHSKLLNTAGEKEQNAFLNKIITKIHALESLIKASSILDFQ